MVTSWHINNTHGKSIPLKKQNLLYVTVGELKSIFWLTERD